jgi:hypothetical protein
LRGENPAPFLDFLCTEPEHWTGMPGLAAPPSRGASRCGRPRHLSVALVGFAVLLALRRAEPHPKPWSLA